MVKEPSLSSPMLCTEFFPFSLFFPFPMNRAKPAGVEVVARYRRVRRCVRGSVLDPSKSFTAFRGRAACLSPNPAPSPRRCCTVEKEPERGRWGLLRPQLISHLSTALFDHFLSNSGGFKHAHGCSQCPCGTDQALPPCPWAGSAQPCVFVCHLGSLPAADLSGVFVVPGIPLKLLNSSLRSLADGDLQPGGLLQNRGW